MGSGCGFVTDDDDDGLPYDCLEIYRKDASAPNAPRRFICRTREPI